MLVQDRKYGDIYNIFTNFGETRKYLKIHIDTFGIIVYNNTIKEFLLGGKASRKYQSLYIPERQGNEYG